MFFNHRILRYNNSASNHGFTILGLLLLVKTDDYKTKVNREGKTKKRNEARNNSGSSIINQREKQNAKNHHKNNSNNRANDVWNQERCFVFNGSDDQ